MWAQTAAAPRGEAATGGTLPAGLEVFPVDAEGRRLDVRTSHASLSRVLPDPLLPATTHGDADALSWVVAGAAAALPTRLDFVATSPGGVVIDRLDEVLLRTVPCPRGVARDRSCAATLPIRATADRIDRSHPAVVTRSLQARVGGRIAVRVGDDEVVSIPVGGPRQSALGALERYRARVRMHLVRIDPGGAPPVGGDDAGALELARREVAAASAIWGQCGVYFDDDVAVGVVDPPPPYLLAVGCELGLPASGGEIALRVDDHPIRVPTQARETPAQVAWRVAGAIRGAGYQVDISPNARVGSGALRTVDLIVSRGGRRATLTPEGTRPVSTDPSLSVCIGAVDLSDGLTHFTDFTAAAGTIEERTLVKAFADTDPGTIDVVVIPAFAQTSRIGESFIRGDGSSIRNVVIIDRSAVHSRAHSQTLAHEIGHVFLDMPGHPDDYGIDRPELLMDSDAADATIFGPRRLELAECERALRQSGPTAPVPLLEAVPLERRP